VALAYLSAVAVAGAVGLAVGRRHPILVVAVADLAATLAVFAWSTAVANSSVYDAYWSVAPPLIGAYWLAAAGVSDASAVRQVVVLGLVGLWAVRLTANWARGWGGLGHEDWRYVDLRAQATVPYWLVSLSGIHLFPTVQVFLACLPLYPALAVGTNGLGPLDVVAVIVTTGAIALETVADEQLRRFVARRQPGSIMDEGLWGRSRHPNYLGEITFWWGLWLFGLAADPSWWWTVVGPLAITAMFVFATVPLLERRSLERRPGYAEHQRKVPALVPRLRGS
jgi:steroid 5-alpha reductase family enzyme